MPALASLTGPGHLEPLASLPPAAAALPLETPLKKFAYLGWEVYCEGFRVEEGKGSKAKRDEVDPKTR
jgi:hypothetical protein